MELGADPILLFLTARYPRNEDPAPAHIQGQSDSIFHSQIVKDTLTDDILLSQIPYFSRRL